MRISPNDRLVPFPCNTVIGIETAPIVLDTQRQEMIPSHQIHMHIAGAGVFDRIVEGFLDDPKNRQFLVAAEPIRKIAAEEMEIQAA